ncbi:MAG: hypothetical protein RIQ38_457 [Pseudomonadota bacterium]|jgi:predicted metalloprotease with PDZ domain
MREPPLHYRVQALDLKAHLWQVELTIAQAPESTIVSLPVWIPGSYLVREFARHLQHLQARQGRRACAVVALDKTRWRIDARAGQALTLRWQVYARDASVRTAWLDEARGFFNGTSLCLMVQGQEDLPHAITLVRPRQAACQRWRAATALRPLKVDARGFGQYLAADYDELVDSPVEMGDFWSGEFEACGVPHRLVISGATADLDGERLLRDAKTICETSIAFWHPGRRPKPPHDRYVFLLNVVHEGYGGLEHRHSTALICNRRDLPRQGLPLPTEGYTTLLGLICHEYFHTWNVKRLRPQALARYDYAQENYTDLLWFFEGFTSYYDDLLLHRAGLVDEATYLKLLARNIEQVQHMPGRQVQSVAQASFDAWTRYYRPDENTPNATVNYYTKGALVALCLDLRLRHLGHSLDALMRRLWQRCDGGPMGEAVLHEELQALGGAALVAELRQWVHSTDELPLADVLRAQEVEIEAVPGTLAQRLGLRHSDGAGGVLIQSVLRGGAAEQAGMAAGDEWIGLALGARGQGEAWRVMRLDDVATALGQQRQAVALVARDRRLLHLPLKMPPTHSVWRLRLPAQRQARWPAA